VGTPQSWHVVLLPYLALRDRLALGPYELIPRQSLVDDDFVSEQLYQQVAGLLEMHKVRGLLADRLGCLVRRRDEQIGAPFACEDLRPIRRAVVAALLDRNPREIGMRSDAQGWHVATSDNAQIYLQQLDGSGYVAVPYGRMVQVAVSGLRIGAEHSVIHLPPELHVPFLGADPDGLYLDALYAALTSGTQEAGRLGRAVDWLDLPWRNTTSLDDDTRILAVYSGFEVLLGREGASGLSLALSELIDPQAAAVTRPIPNRHGNLRPQDVTEIEWWFTFFAFLRHAIAPGDEIPARQYEWNDHHHLFFGESRLRNAIKRKVAGLGFPLVLLNDFERLAVQLGEARVEDFEP
jgi:hypothetical protein